MADSHGPMTGSDLLLARLKQRRVAVDLTTPDGSPLDAATVCGRSIAALGRAGVPQDECEAFARRAAEHVKQAASENQGPVAFGEAVAELMSREDDSELLRVVSEYLVVEVNWTLRPPS